MTVDCRWVEKNLEALFCDKLSDVDSRVVRAHVESCESCRKEVRALNAIDPLIKSYFRRELQIARRPRVVHKARVGALAGTAAAAVMVLLLIIFGRTPPPPSVVPSVARTESNSPAPAASAERPIKTTQDGGEVKLAKPTPESNAPADRRPPPPHVIAADAPDFYVTDPAGYSHTLEDYRGHVVVIAVWSSDRAEDIARFERLYKAYAANSKFRFLGVTNQLRAKPANTTFPVLYNQDSKLFGAKSGEFVLLDENGQVERRGSLAKDFESLRKGLQDK